MAGPLAGVRIIDFTTMISGPLATMMLGDQGADVIKIEAPGGGDYARHVATRRGGFSASFVNNNRNKRSIIIDLKQPQGLEVARELASQADVVVQNFRPGVAARMGIGETTLRALNEALIYVSISGFGFRGPYANKPVFDPLIQAVSGLTTVQAGSDQARPRLVRTILPDKLTAIQASQAITAALFARARSGVGQLIELSMLDTIVAFLWSSDMGAHTFVGAEAESETAQSFIDLIYQTTDGYISVAVMQDKHWQAMANALGQEEWLEDVRFKTPELREINKDARTSLTQQALKEYSTAAALQCLEAADVPCAPVLTRGEMLTHAQVQANQVMLHTQHPQAGELRQARLAPQFSSMTAHDYIPCPAPRYGEHSRQILKEFGYDDARIHALISCDAVQCESAEV